jgi:hypothetical protein
MQQVLRELEKRGVAIGSLKAIELFGGCGKRHTVDYANRIARLEVWEIEPSCEEVLRKKIPQATIHITDTYQQIRKTSERFDLIVVDNPMSIYDGHCEHFDLFPDLFRLAADSAIIVVNAIPNLSAAVARKLPYLFSEKQLQVRRRFYNTDNADDLSWGQIVSAYRGQAEAAGFELEWSFSVRRHFIYYLALKIKRLG